MNVITVSREFGSGGRELGKRLAEFLDYDYYDREIISAVAKESGLDEAYVERTLGDRSRKNLSLSFRGTLASSQYVKNSQVPLLLEQKKVIEKIAGLNKNCVIVGRNADIILKNCCPFNIFVCASNEAKLKRCIERAADGEGLSEKELLRKMKQIDEARRETRELMSGAPWGEKESYHLIINTTDWEIKDVVPAAAEFATRFFGRAK